MSPFKEPQPRKQPDLTSYIKTPPGTFPAKGSGFEPVYPEGVWTMTDSEFDKALEEAKAKGRAEGATETLNDFQLGLAANRADLEYRATALEWAVRFVADATGRQSDNLVRIAARFETYLREGKP